MFFHVGYCVNEDYWVDISYDNYNKCFEELQVKIRLIFTVWIH